MNVKPEPQEKRRRPGGCMRDTDKDKGTFARQENTLKILKKVEEKDKF